MKAQDTSKKQHCKMRLSILHEHCVVIYYALQMLCGVHYITLHQLGEFLFPLIFTE